MAVNPRDVVITAIGFLLVAILTPIGMDAVGTSSNWTKWQSSVATIFTIIFPIIYIIGAALYFLPQFTHK